MPQPVRLKATVARIEDHAPGLRSLILIPERSVPRFRPGQFLHLALDPYDPAGFWPESRIFSIASPPESRSELRITVSVVGAFTRRILELREGVEVWIKLPYGDFIVETVPDRETVLVAGGTGITPFVSLLASANAIVGPTRVLYGVRRAELMIYRHVLETAKLRYRFLTFQTYVEEDPPMETFPGRLTLDAVMSCNDDIGSVYYLSGPPAMIRFFSEGLRKREIEKERIFMDAWE